MFSSVSRRGFSIIEVMAALLVLVVGIYSAAEFFTHAQRSALRTDSQLIGHSLAQLKLEELRASGNALRTSLGSAQTVSLPSAGVGMFEQNPGYSWQARLAQSAPSAISIEVAVYRAGEPQPVALASSVRLAGNSQFAGGAK